MHCPLSWLSWGRARACNDVLLDAVAENEPPKFAAFSMGEQQRLLVSRSDESLHLAVGMKLESNSSEEIARGLDRG